MSQRLEYLKVCKKVIDSYIKAEEQGCMYTMDINQVEIPSKVAGKRKFKYMYYEYDRKNLRIIFDVVQPDPPITMKKIQRTLDAILKRLED
jgi:hypothetical protein